MNHRMWQELETISLVSERLQRVSDSRLPYFITYHMPPKNTQLIFGRQTVENSFFQSHGLELACSWRGCVAK